MKIKIITMISLIVLLFYSCSQDDLIVKENQNLTETVNYEKIQVLNGRLYFPNKITFQNYYKDLRNKDENIVADILESKFYSKDFYSLKPIVNKKTEQIEVTRHLAKIKSNTKGFQQNKSISDIDLLENFDDLEDIFGEDVFTSFLNQDAEIQVENKIYKYTDTGLFITDVNKIDNLNSYLDTKQISKNLLEPTPDATKLAYIQEYNPCGGVKQVESYQYFIAEVDCSGGSGGTGGSSGGSSSNTPSSTPNAQLAVIANGLD